MDPSWLGSTQFEQIPIGESGLIETNWYYETGVDALDGYASASIPFYSERQIGDRNIYGTFTATRVDKDHFLWRDTYNFDMKPWGASAMRNMATMIGEYKALGGDLSLRSQAQGFTIYGTSPALIPGH